MTNKEKYGNEIIELVVNGQVLGLKNGEPALCREIKCEGCDFYESSDSCKGNARVFREWLNSEYKSKVDWSKVAVDTPVLVRDYEGGRWIRRYFAKYEDNTVYAWENGATSWSACRSDNITDWKMAKLAESEKKND